MMSQSYSGTDGRAGKHVSQPVFPFILHLLVFPISSFSPLLVGPVHHSLDLTVGGPQFIHEILHILNRQPERGELSHCFILILSFHSSLKAGAPALFTRASSAVPFLNAGFPDHQLSIANHMHDFV